MKTGVMTKSFHVFVPDQIGFGESDKPLINYRVGTLVDFLNGFYQKVGITKASLVGNSLGGWTALAFTLAHPEKVDRLVLVDSAGYSPERTGGAKLTREVVLLVNPATVEEQQQALRLGLFHKQLVTHPFAQH